MQLAPGTRLDRYQIVSFIGSGGMGEIYLAQDTKLGRRVALKVLPERYTREPERLRRFEQEAIAASSLNHPNIITIYEIGHSGESHFIAAEFIEGRTLRRRLQESRLSVGEALGIAIQIAEALSAAHAAGIVHRDIKPENIMIRPDGYAKVLDFGLAKLSEKSAERQPRAEGTQVLEDTGQVRDISTTETSEQPAIEAEDGDDFATRFDGPIGESVPGQVMGTAQYMSPEQARGIKVDSRTDIFSFGIVLYEMVAGRAPFAGADGRQLAGAIIHDDPLPLSEYVDGVPEVLEWIIGKALVKNRDERYQTFREVVNDLRRLKQRMEIGGSRMHQPSHAVRAANGGDTGEIARPRETGRIAGRRLWRSLAATVVGLAILIAAGYGAIRYFRQAALTPAPFQPMQVRRFTSSGRAGSAAISPDGNYVVYVQGESGRQALFVRQVTSSKSIEIVPPADAVYRGLTFSNDGTSIYYVVQEQNNPIQVLYQVPLLGGLSNKILNNIDSPVAISPDGRRMAFVRRNRASSEDQLVTAGIDGSGESVLASRRGDDFFGIRGPAWTGDGRAIICPAGTNIGGRRMFIEEIRVADGRQQPLSNQNWSNLGRISWMGNGGGLIVSATEQGSTLSQLWHITYPSGRPSRITNDLNDYRDMALTRDARALVSVQSEAMVNVWIVPDGETGKARQITDGIGQYNGVRGLTWMADGRLAYVSRVSGSQDIWLMDSTGQNNQQMTTAETRADIYPEATPDGRFIVFVSTRTGNSNLYKIDLGTRDQYQLTSGTSEEFPSITPDGRWVIYTATGSTNFTLWKISIDGGQPVQITDRLSQWPDVSPDGKRIACWYRDKPAARWQIAILPIEGGAPEKVFEPMPSAETSIPTRWTADGSGIGFVSTRDGVSNIWVQPVDGSQPRQITNFSSDQIFWFDWSNDGRQLACSRGRITSDVVLISRLK